MKDPETIRASLEEGYTEKEIREVLRDQGHTEQEINELLEKARNPAGQGNDQQKDRNLGQEDKKQDNFDRINAYSSLAIFLASTSFYAGIELGIVRISGLASDISLIFLGLTGIVLLLKGVSGARILLTRKKRAGIPPLVESILLSALIGFLIFSRQNIPRIGEFSVGSTAIMSLVVTLNGIPSVSGIFSSYYFRRKLGSVSLAIFFIFPLIAGGTYAFTVTETNNAVKSLEEPSKTVAVEQVELPKQELKNSYSTVPPINRLAGKYRLARFVLEDMRQIHSSKIDEANKEVSLKEPGEICSMERLGFLRNSSKTNRNTKSLITNLARKNEEMLKQNKAQSIRTLKRFCKRNSDCNQSQVSFESEFTRLLENKKDRRKAIEEILGAKSSKVEIDLNPRCSGDEKYKIRVSDIKCGQEPEITVKTQGRKLPGGSILGSVGYMSLEEKEIEEISGTKTIKFEPAFNYNLTEFSEKNVEDEVLLELNLQFKGEPRRLKILAMCKKGGGFVR